MNETLNFIKSYFRITVIVIVKRLFLEMCDLILFNFMWDFFEDLILVISLFSLERILKNGEICYSLWIIELNNPEICLFLIALFTRYFLSFYLRKVCDLMSFISRIAFIGMQLLFSFCKCDTNTYVWFHSLKSFTNCYQSIFFMLSNRGGLFLCVTFFIK